jgi:hypothetical protein
VRYSSINQAKNFKRYSIYSYVFKKQGLTLVKIQRVGLNALHLFNISDRYLLYNVKN